MTEREGKKSGYRGVNYHKAHQKWQASIQRDGKRQHLGLFATAEEAAMAYDAAARHPEGSRACAISWEHALATENVRVVSRAFSIVMYIIKCTFVMMRRVFVTIMSNLAFAQKCQ